MSDKYYLPSRSWDLLDLIARISGNITLGSSYKLYNDTMEWSRVQFSFSLRRKPLYFMMNSIFPSLILSVVTLISFGLPFISQIAIGMTIFLTLSVQSMNTSSAIPIQSEIVPAITLFYVFSSMFVLTSFGWFVLENYFRSRVYLPCVMRILARILIKGHSLIIRCLSIKWIKKYGVKTAKQSTGTVRLLMFNFTLFTYIEFFFFIF
jgi:hypothetical protein